MKKELEVSSDMGTYIPLHQVEEQPKAIKGGTMKEYQVCSVRTRPRSIN